MFKLIFLRESSLEPSTSCVSQSKTKLKTLNWTKIRCYNDISIWKNVNDTILKNPPVSLRFQQIEELFSSKPPIVPISNREPKKNQLITLLDSKRSLAINIFLKQFSKCTIHEIIDRLRCCDQKMSLEHLRCLEKILPEPDEVSMLKSYNGETTILGIAEQFLLELVNLPSYYIRIKASILKSDLRSSILSLKEPLLLILSTCKNIINNKSLRSFLAVVLQMGNFLNSNSYAGNCCAFKLTALKQLAELRANKPRFTLLHYIVDISDDSPSLEILNFTHQLATVKSARKYNLDAMLAELRSWKLLINQFQSQLTEADAELNEMVKDFLTEATEEVAIVDKIILDISYSISQVAIYFCEEPAKMNISELFSLFADLLDQIEIARKENEAIKMQEKRAAARLADNETLKMSNENKRKMKFEKMDEEVCIVDRLFADIRRGEFKLRTRYSGNEEEKLDL